MYRGHRKDSREPVRSMVDFKTNDYLSRMARSIHVSYAQNEL